jgi:hypothetical protein
VISILQMCGNGWDEDEIFGESSKIWCANELFEHFKAKNETVHYLTEVKKAFISTHSFIDELEQYTFLRSKKIRDHQGNLITLYNRVFQSHQPFSKNAFYIRTYPPVDKLVGKILKLLPKKPNYENSKIRKLKDLIDKCIAAISTKNPKEAFEIAKQYFSDRIESDLTLSKPFSQNLSEMGDYHHWTTITFQPYLEKLVNLQDLNQLNTFMGFHLLDYQPSVRVKIKETLTWEYLLSVWGWKGEKMEQLNFLLDLVAWKLQNPCQRSHRLPMMISEEQGTGKSFFYEGILVMVFGAMYCNFHDNFGWLLVSF